MKVAKINNIHHKKAIKPTCMQRVKQFFMQNPKGIKIKVLLEDVFDSTINRSGWFDYLGPSRELPNCVSGPDEDYSFKDAGYLKFYPEDEEKMKNMTPRERIDYGDVLIQQGKYIKD